MKNNILILILLILTSYTLLSARTKDLADEYRVRPGDSFLIHVMAMEPQEIIVPVTLTGYITLYPLSSPLKVAGYTLTEAKNTITAELIRLMPGALVFVDLYDMIPYTVHLLGAVTEPGEYVVDTLMTLYQSLELAQGLSPAASKRVRITRNEETKTYDLNRYLMDGTLSENPLVFSDDIIRADFAVDFAKVFVVTDSVNYVEYFEMETEKRVAELLPLIRKKYSHSNYQLVHLYRDGKSERIDQDYLVKAGDSIYLQPEESHIFVRGNVNEPGRFSFYPGKGPQHYISMAGGVNRVGSNQRVFIVSSNGEKKRYRGQDLKEGDAVLVPLSTRTWVTDYITPISAIISVVATIVVLTR